MNGTAAHGSSPRHVVDAAGDLVTEDLAVELLGAEEVHRVEFRGFETEYADD